MLKMSEYPTTWKVLHFLPYFCSFTDLKEQTAAVFPALNMKHNFFIMMITSTVYEKQYIIRNN